MKRKILVLTTMVIMGSIYQLNTYANRAVDSAGLDQGYSFIQTYKVTPPVNLKISTTGGNISTTGRDDNTIEVSFIIAKRGQVLPITFAQLKDYADVEINTDNSNLEIKVKKIYEHNISVGFNIKTPVKTSATLNTSGGNLYVVNIEGKHTLNTSGGNINLAKITGSMDARTSGGNITINESTADYYASTSGGNISAENVNGKLEISTSGGNISAKNITHGLTGHTSGGNVSIQTVQGPVDVETSGGDMHLDDISGSVKAHTSGGDVSATLIKLTGPIDLGTSGGSLHAVIPAGLGLDLDLSADDINTPLTNFSGTAKKNRIVGKMNGGGILVHMSTSGGSISLIYK